MPRGKTVKTATDAADTAGLDCITDALHPRRTTDLIGQDAVLNIISRAIRGGRPPGGWLLSGPPGIGKATLAYRIARYLLTYGAGADGPEDLSVPPDAPVAQQITAGSHPGLLVLKRGTNPSTGKPMSVLPVEEVRRLAPFFGMTAGAGGWRVAIIDTADDMNAASANALLKLLEEPPPRAVMLILAHAPGRMLPTIKSRCQKLALRPLSDGDMDALLTRALPDSTPEQRSGLIRLAAGAPGAAMRLAEGDGLELAQAADSLIDQAGSPDIAALFALADKLARVTDGLSIFSGFLVQALETRIRRRALEGDARGLTHWSSALQLLTTHLAQLDNLHLDPKAGLMHAATLMHDSTDRGGAL